MSRAADCAACMMGDHDGHVRDWNIRPGFLGGEYCACPGDCAERAERRNARLAAMFGLDQP